MEQQQQRPMSRAVTPLELFFDLVFVFAIAQLSQHLLQHLSAITSTAPMTRSSRPGWR